MYTSSAKTIKVFLLILPTSFLMLFCLSKAALGKIEYNAIFTFLGYFAYTLITIRILKDRLSFSRILFLLFTSLFLMQAYTIYLVAVGKTVPLPMLFVYSFGILSAAFFYKFRSILRFLPVTLGLVFVMFMFFAGWDYWIYYNNFGTFTGRISQKQPTRFQAFDEKNASITDENFQGKIVILDYWYTRCGVCFNRFPHLQAAYDRYASDPEVSIYAVDWPIKEDKPGEAFQAIKDEGYSFPVLIASDEEMPAKWGVTGYPTTFVIDRAGAIVFKGDIEDAVRTVDELKEKN